MPCELQQGRQAIALIYICHLTSLQDEMYKIGACQLMNRGATWHQPSNTYLTPGALLDSMHADMQGYEGHVCLKAPYSTGWSAQRCSTRAAKSVLESMVGLWVCER